MVVLGSHPAIFFTPLLLLLHGVTNVFKMLLEENWYGFFSSRSAQSIDNRLRMRYKGDLGLYVFTYNLYNSKCNMKKRKSAHKNWPVFENVN